MDKLVRPMFFAILGALTLACQPKGAGSTGMKEIIAPVEARDPETAMVVAQTSSAPLGYEKTLRSVALAIEHLVGEHPQLREFSVAEHFDPERLMIQYGYHTHKPTHRGGWTSGVPNPDDDGVWFYIDFHDPDSMAQIHTQPVMPELRYREKRIAFLILEGAATSAVGGRLMEILRDNGVVPATPVLAPESLPRGAHQGRAPCPPRTAHHLPLPRSLRRWVSRCS